MAVNGLSIVGQDDFSEGAFTDQADVPASGLTDGINALLNDQGLPYRRGVSVYLANADTSDAVFFWTGQLPAGKRTIWRTSNGKCYTLAGDGVTPTEIATGHPTTVAKAAVVAGTLVLPGGKVWGGARKADYSTGTVAVTAGSTAVVGTGSSWAANVDAGMIFTAGGKSHVVASVTDNTHLTLTEPFSGSTASGAAYTLQTFGTAGKLVSIYASVANKLFACSGDKIFQSGVSDPFTFASADWVQLPAGVSILGAEPFRDSLLVFTTAGMWALSNVAFEIEDGDGNPQQRLEQIGRDLILWSWTGVASWGNVLIVPATDGVWMLDSLSEPGDITNGIVSQYLGSIAAGYSTGLATVFRNHYLLPIRIGTGSTGLVQVFACRLNATRRGRRLPTFGWTRFNGHASRMFGFGVDSDGVNPPKLIGVDNWKGRINELRYWGPTGADGDGTDFLMFLTTRQFDLGSAKTLVNALRLRYELLGASASWSVEYSLDGAGFVALSTSATPASMASNPLRIPVNKAARGIRFQFTDTGATNGATLHRVEVLFRPSGKQ